MPFDRDWLEILAQKLGESWPALFLARQRCREHMEHLRRILASDLRPPANTSVVVFGSLAREEWTSGSDVDWTLLIDGPADMRHFDVAKSIEDSLLAAAYLEPGPMGTFGSMASSHELVHYIGGSEDTNHNMTRRILLLLESSSLSDPIAHERVVRAVLERYIVGDPPAMGPANFHVPLFLLNDIVRFWRTLTVDYATKKWQRSNRAWALRNAKLRMSRKLLFVKGMLLCFLCDDTFAPLPTSQESEVIGMELVDYCFKLSRIPALELLAWAMYHLADESTGLAAMRAYDNFLATLDDPQKREHLATLEFGTSDDALFNAQRRNNQSFRDSLDSLFFDTNERLCQLTRRYGIF